MQVALATSTRTSVALRLVFSLILGALTGIYAHDSAPVDGVIAIALLLLPPVLSLARDPSLVRKGAAILRYVIALLIPLLVAGFLAWSAGGGGLSPAIVSISSNYQVLAVIAIPAIAAFAFGSVDDRAMSSIGLAIGCAATAWVGVGLRNFTQATLAGTFSSANGNDFAGLGLALMVLFYAVGFGIACLEALLGAELHAWATRKAR